MFFKFLNLIFKSFFPAKIKYYFYINKIELNEKNPSFWLKENILRYIVLFSTPLIVIYYKEILDSPLKIIDFSTAKVLFWVYLIIFVIDYLRNRNEEFMLQLK